eukprot:scaffold278312_cov33-Tisochrysis_lutea.AAC.1
MKAVAHLTLHAGSLVKVEACKKVSGKKLRRVSVKGAPFHGPLARQRQFPKVTVDMLSPNHLRKCVGRCGRTRRTPTPPACLDRAEEAPEV